MTIGFVLFVTGKPPDVAKWRVSAIGSTLLLYTSVICF